jgi:hypothetical protein
MPMESGWHLHAMQASCSVHTAASCKLHLLIMYKAYLYNTEIKLKQKKMFYFSFSGLQIMKQNLNKTAVLFHYSSDLSQEDLICQIFWNGFSCFSQSASSVWGPGCFRPCVHGASRLIFIRATVNFNSSFMISSLPIFMLNWNSKFCFTIFCFSFISVL